MPIELNPESGLPHLHNRSISQGFSNSKDSAVDLRTESLCLD